jgi:hypothetical protein
VTHDSQPIALGDLSSKTELQRQRLPRSRVSPPLLRMDFVAGRQRHVPGPILVAHIGPPEFQRVAPEPLARVVERTALVAPHEREERIATLQMKTFAMPAEPKRDEGNVPDSALPLLCHAVDDHGVKSQIQPNMLSSS